MLLRLLPDGRCNARWGCSPKCSGFLLAMAIGRYTLVIMQVARNQDSPGLGIPMDYVYFGMVIGSVVPRLRRAAPLRHVLRLERSAARERWGSHALMLVALFVLLLVADHAGRADPARDGHRRPRRHPRHAEPRAGAVSAEDVRDARQLQPARAALLHPCRRTHFRRRDLEAAGRVRGDRRRPLARRTRTCVGRVEHGLRRRIRARRSPTRRRSARSWCLR